MNLTLHAILSQLACEWSQPKRPSVGDSDEPELELACVVEEDSREVKDDDSPVEIRDLWRRYRTVKLFVDATYGQWGLVFLDQQGSEARTSAFAHDRSGEYRSGDRIVGEFLGDSDLLLLRCDPQANDFGRVLVAMPLDTRTTWPVVGCSLKEFLEQYGRQEGRKFWERA